MSGLFHFLFFASWWKSPKSEKISCHFQPKCRFFMQKINKQDSWFFSFLVTLTKKRKMKWTRQKWWLFLKYLVKALVNKNRNTNPKIISPQIRIACCGICLLLSIWLIFKLPAIRTCPEKHIQSHDNPCKQN